METAAKIWEAENREEKLPLLPIIEVPQQHQVPRIL